jgi:hypothetical protein
LEYLKAIGFRTILEDAEEVLRIDNVVTSDMEAVMFELNNALEMVTTLGGDNVGEEKKVEYERTTSTVSTSSSTTGKITEKQKARMLMEKKEQEEREEAKRARKQTREQIKQGELQSAAMFIWSIYLPFDLPQISLGFDHTAQSSKRQIC